MINLLLSIELFLLGLVLGSFGGAMVWRLRARQLRKDKDAGEVVNKKEYSSLKKLLGVSLAADRSQCLHCHHQLAWYDLLPLVSWVQLGGKCRYCRRPIGWMEPLIEVSMAILFVASYLLWPVPLTSTLVITQFVLWLIVCVGLIIMFAYDIRWFLLPNHVMFPLIGVALLSSILRLVYAPDFMSASLDLLAACAILSGLYYILHIISRGTWIGFGDIKLGLVMGLMLANWQLAFLTLFLANLIGCIVVIPGLISRRLNRSSHIPFGPLLIVAYFIAGLVGQHLVDWYLTGFSLY